MQTLAATEDERGSSTAEFAVILPALVFVLALVLGAAATGIVQLKLEEGARLGARAAARGETAETVTRIVQEIDPAATVTLAQNDDMTVVTVSRQAPGVMGKVSGWTLTADARALTEQGPASEGGSP
ncbi:pilus assembly protein TadE [Rothia nasimurium]|uniref:Pilus assembly protein TadE n=1 Tax=Rothia nasimurium TaxID=85336 RepID=A0A4Y9F4R1_9MICC|nr:TadE family type IV pilus minor pilin [Rothia nasimurium]MBF0808286.1 pilus assembly protein [Rothia nasimurium]TFU22242.1 pilus assembly protein TadE [Rothia nasimurium]